MTAGEQVKTAVIDCLNAAGLAAVGAYEAERFQRYETAVAAVGLRKLELCAAGHADYLGLRRDLERGDTEVYGKAMELTLSLDVYAPRTLGASACETAAEEAAQALLGALPSGLRLAALRWDETHWDKDCGMFLRCGTAECSAYFLAEGGEESAALRDFILRGVLNNDQYGT